MSGDLVVPLDGLTEHARERAASGLLRLATRAVLHRAEMTVRDLAASGTEVT